MTAAQTQAIGKGFAYLSFAPERMTRSGLGTGFLVSLLKLPKTRELGRAARPSGPFSFAFGTAHTPRALPDKGGLSAGVPHPLALATRQIQPSRRERR